MCTGIVESRKISGSGKGPSGWFLIDQASVSYDHPDHFRADRVVIIDLLSETSGPQLRIAVELTPQSARSLVHAILASLSRGEGETAGARNDRP
jgi:hypothetical protein